MLTFMFASTHIRYTSPPSLLPITNHTAVPGGRGGHTCAAVLAAGCYAPGGRYPLPSSVLMTVATARAAGVRDVWACSPRPNPLTLAAAHVAGADGLVGVGGAQAIACMAHGASNGCVLFFFFFFFGQGMDCISNKKKNKKKKKIPSPLTLVALNPSPTLCFSSAGLERYNGGAPLPDIPSCDVVVGPGNKFVTAAKALVSGTVGIDMLAGPSEVLVVMDGTADAGHVAADLIAQAEHDTDARAILVAVDADPARAEALVAAVDAELTAQLETLPTRETAEAALSCSYAVTVADLAAAAAVCNAVAPEHLQLLLEGAHPVQ
jgi:histidinol dehydrogenase